MAIKWPVIILHRLPIRTWSGKRQPSLTQVSISAFSIIAWQSFLTVISRRHTTCCWMSRFRVLPASLPDWRISVKWKIKVLNWRSMRRRWKVISLGIQVWTWHTTRIKYWIWVMSLSFTRASRDRTRPVRISDVSYRSDSRWEHSTDMFMTDFSARRTISNLPPSRQPSREISGLRTSADRTAFPTDRSMTSTVPLSVVHSLKCSEVSIIPSLIRISIWM